MLLIKRRAKKDRLCMVLSYGVDIMKMDTLARSKISKCHFSKDIENSFHEATHIGLEPHQFFFLFRISQQIQSLETSKVLAEMAHGWQAG